MARVEDVLPDTLEARKTLSSTFEETLETKMGARLQRHYPYYRGMPLPSEPDLQTLKQQNFTGIRHATHIRTDDESIIPETMIRGYIMDRVLWHMIQRMATRSDWILM